MLKGFALQTERRAQKLRELAGLNPTGRINPLDIAKMIEGVVLVGGFDNVSAFVGREVQCNHLEEQLSALTVQIHKSYYVIENHTHTLERRRISLMEEFSHILLGHKPTTVSLTPNALLAHRTFNDKQEREAYALGAATLVPYDELRALLTKEKQGFDEVGEYYAVSRELIAYRAKVTLIWRGLKRAGLLDAAR